MNILIVDDHPLIVSVYKNILHEYNDLHFTINCAYNCQEAFNILVQDKGAFSPEIAILDYNLPIYAEKNLHSGIDIARLVRTHYQNCKIIFVTGHVAKLQIFDIIKKISPEGIAVKNDITSDNFMDMIFSVAEGGQFQSYRIKEYIKDM